MFCGNCGYENAAGAKFCVSCGAKMGLVEGDGDATRPMTVVAMGGGRIGPYELRDELGRGAMARVWRAWDPNLEREVAVKEPMFDPRLDEATLEEMGRRFVREGRTAARLQHPGIVSIFAADVYDGRTAIVMELVEGDTLGKILKGGPLAPEVAIDVLDQLLDAVGYAHSQGVVHRDIKPENVFVSSDGRVKLADFGIARVDDSKATQATAFGSVLGTPGYMSPEQATGSAVDARSDLFSIGVVGYEMLAGRNPFGAGDGADTTALLYRIVHEPAPELPESASAGLPADLRPAIMAALAKDPAERPQTAADLKAMLHGASSSPTVRLDAAAVPPPEAAPSVPPSEEASPVLKSKAGGVPKWLPLACIAAACAIILAAVFLVIVPRMGEDASSEPSSSESSPSASSEPSSASADPAAYLAVRDGKVAIFTNGSAEPYRVTKVAVSDLPDEFVREVESQIGFASVEEAEDRIKAYRSAIKAAQERAEREAEGGSAESAEADAKTGADIEAPASNVGESYVVIPSGAETKAGGDEGGEVRAETPVADKGEKGEPEGGLENESEDEGLSEGDETSSDEAASDDEGVPGDEGDSGGESPESPEIPEIPEDEMPSDESDAYSEYGNTPDTISVASDENGSASDGASE